MLSQMKRNAETIWLREVDSIAIQSSLKNLSDSFSRFFKKQNRRPQFKSKKHPIQSYTTKNVNNSIEIRNNFVKLPKLGLVKLAKSQEPKGRILHATIRKIQVVNSLFLSFVKKKLWNTLKPILRLVLTWVLLILQSFLMAKKLILINSRPKWKRNSIVNNVSCQDVPH